ncbi:MULTISPECIES: hypothetical protein [Kaistia]|uniref:Uncharacterized protein n=1 Tax=Kaistia nematophila TaxID=2994654 RepID=A0A9X3E6Z6_9HYPH|nr:hypothetical protein [Kaistia nematophila]MBN9059355.1 hypothetical protein [Hyphomicrobiales bacterium]MCX5571882.1 hypothetical protein [Kaistia nematophila]
MANAIPGMAAKGDPIPVSPGRDHAHSHEGHDHEGKGHGRPHDHDLGHVHSHAAGAPVARDFDTALPRSYRRSMFLASAVERLVIAALLVGLIWLGIFWAVS